MIAMLMMIYNVEMSTNSITTFNGPPTNRSSNICDA